MNLKRDYGSSAKDVSKLSSKPFRQLFFLARISFFFSSGRQSKQVSYLEDLYFFLQTGQSSIPLRIAKWQRLHSTIACSRDAVSSSAFLISSSISSSISFPQATHDRAV
ncbi:MAG: hypothetical protein QM426_08090 [Euryarchaeota archaeon]|nr:hypothetical protein [Euryarchaeota archaeon]